MMVLGILLVMMVSLSACVDAPVNVGITPTGKATLQWTSPVPFVAHFHVDGASQKIYLMRSESDIQEVVRLDANSGQRLPAADLVGISSYSESKDQRYIAMVRDQTLSVLRRSDGQQITSVSLNDSQRSSPNHILAWDGSAESLFVWATGNYGSALFRMPNTAGANLSLVASSPWVDESDALWRLRPLSASNTMHVRRTAVLDATDLSLRDSYNVSTSASVWPSRDGMHWFACEEDKIVKRTRSGAVVSTLPINRPEAMGDMEVEDMVVSGQDRYAALWVIDYGSPVMMTELWVVDLSNGSHVCHVQLGTNPLGDNQIVFDPSNERVLYVNDYTQMQKWSF